MSKRFGLAVFLLFGLLVILVAARYLTSHDIAVLNPQGLIAGRERQLIIIAGLLSLIVVIPVYILTFTIAWRYREGNHKAKYTPDWDHHRGAEFTWWALPFAIILVLSVITWQSSHELDPFKPIASKTQPITIQVVALDWKWLFIYPEQDIATVNYVQFPEHTPVNFQITADAPMNSFWIPSLGGQIYAMSGMSTELHLMADRSGTYHGSSANLSGPGFAGMKFIAKASSQSDFEDWVQSVHQSVDNLSLAKYKELARPSKNNHPTFYSAPADNLYNQIVTKYVPFGHAHSVGG